MERIVMKINGRKEWQARHGWIVPVCFGFSCALITFAVIFLMIRGFVRMEREWIFSIGADLFCMAVCVMLCFSSVLNSKVRNTDTYIFITLLTTDVFALFLDEMSWIVQGFPEMRIVNLCINVLFFMVGFVLIYLFWVYIRRALKLRDKAMQYANMFVTVMLFPSLLMCLTNFFYPIFFEVDENGVYVRAAQWDVSQLYLSIAFTVVIIAIAFSKATTTERFVAISFVAIPMLNQFLTSNIFGRTTQYAAMTVSIVLIHGVLFADREKTLAATEMELGVATKIQENMLPSTFPFMPERTEFDLYASMTPAKEVGGDFYDFFMIDDNHLALVIADVSGKGIPAALFMMASKILIKNTVMTGKNPAEVLRVVNNQICGNNQEEMFVTVWLGVLNLDDGVLISANAGHEYPIVKCPGGDFELIKTKHSFVVGGVQGVRYMESEWKLEPGSKLFVYTDGVTEANNQAEELYGLERFLSVLNKHQDVSPKALLEAVEADVEQFAQNQPQFDDLTMLCIHYRGKEQ